MRAAWAIARSSWSASTVPWTTPSRCVSTTRAGPLQSSTRKLSRTSCSLTSPWPGGQPAMKRAAEASVNGPRGSSVKAEMAPSLRARPGVRVEGPLPLDGVVDDRLQALAVGRPAACVGAAGGMALGLPRWVVEARVERRGVDADRRDPLPVAVVGGDVAVEQVAHEVLLAAAPVHVQILDEKAGRDQPRAVVHPARLEQLAHAGVDHREARAAVAPGVEVLVRTRPLDRVEVALEGVARVARVVQQHVRVEVAPGELAGVRAAGARLELAGADRAEVQVRGQPGGVAVQAVARAVVGRVVEGVHALAARALAAARARRDPPHAQLRR